MNSRANFAERARRFGLSVTNFTPSTGIGKFDARYEPTSNELKVTLKVNYEWRNLDGKPPWHAGEMQDFKKRFKEVVEETRTRFPRAAPSTSRFQPVAPCFRLRRGSRFIT